MIWSIFRRFSHNQRFRYVGNFLHPRYAIHRIPHPREVSLRVNPVFQKNATSSPPLAILTDQACKPFTRKAPLVAPLGMLTATRRKSTRLSFFIIPFSEQVRWGPVVVISVKIEFVRRSLHLADPM